MKIIFDRRELTTKANEVKLMPMTLDGWAFIGRELFMEKFRGMTFKVCHVNLTEKGKVKNVQFTV